MRHTDAVRDCIIHTRVPNTRVFTWYPIPGYFVWVPGYQETTMVWWFLGDVSWGKLHEKLIFLIQAIFWI